MGIRFALRLGLILTSGLLILLLAVTGLGPLLPDAGQLGFETEAASAYYMLDVARRIQHPIIYQLTLRTLSVETRGLNSLPRFKPA